MSATSSIKPARGWSVEGFEAFWANPDPANLPRVRDIVTDDIVGYWPKPIGMVRGAAAYMGMIESVVAERSNFSLRVAEHAGSGDFTFVRWIATLRDAGGEMEFTGCDRLRTRGGLVCENYVFCDHPFFGKVAARIGRG